MINLPTKFEDSTYYKDMKGHRICRKLGAFRVVRSLKFTGSVHVLHCAPFVRYGEILWEANVINLQILGEAE